MIMPTDSDQPRSPDGRRLDWVRAKLARIEPDYRFKWDVYFDRLEQLARTSSCFLDAGCGDNSTANELNGPGLCIGTDIAPIGHRGHQVKCRLEQLAFAGETFDLVGCRHVVEHLHDPAAVFAELRRVMRPGGRLLIQTVNKNSLLIRLSRRMGRPLRRLLIRHRYGRAAADLFPVFDRFNRPELFSNPPGGFRLVTLQMTQDVDTQSRWGFWFSFVLVRRTRSRPLRRSTITAEWERL